MQTRKRREAQILAGLPISPPQHLTPERRRRAPKKRSAKQVKNSSTDTDPSKDADSEATASCIPPRLAPGPAGPNASPNHSAQQPPRRVSATRRRSSVVPPIPFPLYTEPPVPQTLIHIWVDASTEVLASVRPLDDPKISLAIPSSIVPDLLSFLAGRPATKQRNQLTCPVANYSFSPDSPSNKRKLADDAPMPQPAQRARIEAAPPSPPPAGVNIKPKGSFSQGLSRQVLAESNLQAKSSSRPRPSDTASSSVSYRQVKRYAADGSLQLGLEPVPIGADDASMALWQPSQAKHLAENRPPPEELSESKEADKLPQSLHPDIAKDDENTGDLPTKPSTEASEQSQRQNVPETPRARRWGISGLIDSARSVTKFLPGLNPRPNVLATVAEDPVDSNTSPTPIRSQHTAQTEPRRNTRTVRFTAEPSTVQFTAEPSTANPKKPRTRPKQSSSSGRFRSKGEMTKARNRKLERDFMQEQAKIVIEEDERKAKDLQAQNELRQQAVTATTPGAKRKRVPSPDVIPNPPGTSYGMDLAYFGYDSSEEDESEIDTTPSKRLTKSRRISKEKPSTVIVGDPKKARPYSGTIFGKSPPDYHGGNVFGEMNASKEATEKVVAAQKAGDFQTRLAEKKERWAREKEERLRELREQRDLPPTPIITNLSGTFRVPSPSSSDSDSDPSPEENTGPRSRKESSKEKESAPRVGQSSSTKSATPQRKDPEPWKKPPPPRPTPSHAALPPTVISTDSGARSSPTRTAQSSLSGPTGRTNALPSVNSHGGSNESEALRIQRVRAEKYLPKKPSGLRSASRMNSSPLAEPNVNETESAVKPVVPVQKASSTYITGVMKHKPKTVRPNNAKMSTPPSLAGITNITQSNAYEDYRKSVDPVVAACLEEANVNVDAAKDAFKAGLTYFKVTGKEKSQEVAITSTAAPVVPISPQGSKPVIKFAIDPQVQAYIDSQFTKEVKEDAITTFRSNLAVFRDLEKPKTGAVTAA